MEPNTNRIAAAVELRPLAIPGATPKPGAKRRSTVVRTGARDRDEPWSLRLLEAECRRLECDLDGLTDREREVVFAICSGGPNEAVAERLYIALPTLRTHLMRINQKLGTRSKADVVRFVVGRLLEAYRVTGPLPTERSDGLRRETGPMVGDGRISGMSGGLGAGEIEIKRREKSGAS
jgi:DNA-binding CsgD family transcriptional regulator